MRVRKLYLLAATFYAGILSAQPPQPEKFLPVMAPSSPEAAAFSRYGNYQVNLFTGVPDISIPLYEIKIGELSVPVTLSYHASGIKVNEIPSRAGLGWSLQAGGSITRKIMGRADELAGNYLSATTSSDNRVKLTSEINPLTAAGVDYLWNVDRGFYDVEPDIFSYSFPGHSGKFLFNQKNGFAPVMIPYAPIEVTKTNPLNQLTLAMTDESGINYKFGATESTYTTGGVPTQCTSAWLLSEMISANDQDTVYFRYVNPGFSPSQTDISDYLVLNDNCTGTYQQGTQCSTTGQFFSSTSISITDSKQLTQIDFKNGKIVFEAAPELREDFSSQQKRLSAIKIYNYDPLYKTYSLIRTITFFHSYFTPAGTKRLKLDSIQLKSGSGTTVETYRFTYNLSISLPSTQSRMKDYWGYFNNVTNLDPFGFPTSIKKMQVPYTVNGSPPVNIWIGGDKTYARDPDPTYMQACILQKITFPTGGYSEFEYETNKYLDDQGVATYAGGLRVKLIKSYTSSTAAPVIKTYKYGLSESGYGRANFLMEDHFFMSVQNVRVGRGLDPGGVICLPTPNTKTTRTYFANPTNDLESFDGAPVVYPYVTEYIGDGTTNAGRTKYIFLDKADAKTTITGYGKPMLTSYHFVRGLLINRSDERRNVDGSYTIVAENRKKYQHFPFASTTGGIGLVVLKSLVTEDAVGLSYCSGGLCDCNWTDSYSYLYSNYEIVSADNKLIKDTTITYDQNDPARFASVIKSYSYDDITHVQMKRSQVTNSKGETISTGYTYPYNYGTTPYTTMNTNHIWDKVVTDTVTNSVSGQLTLKKNNFQSFAGNNFLPANIELKIKTNTMETRASFNQYDLNGNILEMQKTDDIKQSYIWDYNGMQPIAEVINAGQPDIAYTSFEADGKGNWTFTGPPGLDPTAPTGKRCYTLGTNITKSGLSTSTTYIVSYWKKSGTVAVNATTPVTGRSVSGWTYYEHKVINPSGGLITVSGTSGVIDELRLYPASNVQMTTYTYTPLIGVTSQCDVNNRITYYEYDRFNRLILIRDQDKNILKQLCYNYAGQPENCGIAYNQQQSGIFTKNNCSGCQAGSTVTYIVPANTHSAPTVGEANQLASDDVAVNGQAYADANGTCSTPPNANVTGSNAINQTHTFYFHNNCTSTNYNFSMGPNAPLNTLGTVPTGNYDVTFNPPAGSGQYTYRIGSLTLHANSGTIYNVTVGTGGVVVNITP